jgi:predicted transcriptional regulator
MTAPDNNGSGSLTLEALENLPPIIPLQRLSVPALAVLLSKHYSQAHIARLYGVSDQAVSDYIKKHSDELQHIKDYDNVITSKFKHLIGKAVDSLDNRDFQRDRLGDINNLIGTFFDKIRLHEGKSTANVSSIIHISASVEAHILKQSTIQDVVVDSE